MTPALMLSPLGSAILEPIDDPAPKPSRRPALVPGDTGADVETLQRYLSWLGHYAGEVTGRYDATTVEAVRAFQRVHGLVLTGIADHILWNLLEYRPVEPSQTRARIVGVRWVNFDGETLSYLGHNSGTVTAPTTRDELRLRRDPDADDGEPVLIAHCVSAEIPAESTYLGCYHLGLLPDGDYVAVIHFDVETPAPGRRAATGDQDIGFTIRVAGTSPTFIAWR